MTVEEKAGGVREAIVQAAAPAPGEAVKRRGLVWVVVLTKPNQERRAREQLQNQAATFGEGFDVYLPLKLIPDRYRAGQVIPVPFFPRYLFARIDLRLSSWKRVWSTLGVHGILGASPDRPYGLADWVIERLQAQEDAGFIRMGLAGDESKGRSFREGEAVRLGGSPLEAVFLETVDAKRAAILVSLLGRDSRVTVDLAKIRSAATD